MTATATGVDAAVVSTMDVVPNGRSASPEHSSTRRSQMVSDVSAIHSDIVGHSITGQNYGGIDEPLPPARAQLSFSLSAAGRRHRRASGKPWLLGGPVPVLDASTSLGWLRRLVESVSRLHLVSEFYVS